MRAEAKAAIACLVGGLLWFLPWLLPGKALLGIHPGLLRPYEEVFDAATLAELKEASHPLYLDKLLQHDPEVRFGSEPSGPVPSWDPWVLGGVPHIAQGLASPLYPPLWIARFVPPPRCYAWIAALQTALAAWFAFRMARAFSIAPAGASVAALLFGASGWMSVHQEYFQLTAAATWLPLAIGSAKRLLDRQGGLFSLAVAIACGFLSGFPQIGFYVLLVPALLAVVTTGWRFARRQETALETGGHALRFGAAALFGLALASPQLLATAEFVPHSTRAPYDAAQIEELALPPAALLGALLPDLFAPSFTQADVEAETARAVEEKRTPWIDTLYARAWLDSLQPERLVNRFEITCTLGPAALLLALLGLLRGRRGARGFFVLLLLLGLALALRSPLLRALAHLPGFNIGDPKRALLLVTTALAGLAALGGEAAWREARERRLLLGLLTGASALLLLAAGGAALLPLSVLRDHAAPPIARSVGVPTEVIADALRDAILVGQRALLGRELLVAAGWCVVALLALLWLHGALLHRRADDGALADVRTPSRLAPLRARLPDAAFLAALAAPLAWLWADATHPIPTAGLDARPSVVWHFEQHRARGRLLRMGARGDLPPWPPKLPMRSKVRDAQGYVAAYSRYWRDLFEAIAPGSTKSVAVLPIDDPAALAAPLIDLLDVEYVLAALPAGSVPPQLPGFELEPLDPPPPPEASYQLTLWRNEEACGRARLLDTLYVGRDDAAVVAALAEPSFAPTRVAWVAQQDAAPLLADPRWQRSDSGADGVQTLRFAGEPTDGAGAAAGEASVQLVEESSNGLRFRVRGDGGLLVQSDCWYPGWVARIDGVLTPLLRVDHALRGVTVPPGEHDVQFLYVPRRLLLGIYLLPGAAALLVLAAVAFGRKRVLV
ncbi:MAG: hypothetical protein JNL90_02330 [Planctomycetes bacterium]|nr:hypothetical protein [Planctomycetota bacterium]